MRILGSKELDPAPRFKTRLHFERQRAAQTRILHEVKNLSVVPRVVFHQAEYVHERLEEALVSSQLLADQVDETSMEFDVGIERTVELLGIFEKDVLELLVEPQSTH